MSTANRKQSAYETELIIEREMVKAVELHSEPTPLTIISALEKRFRGPHVRFVYWRLISDGVIHRSADGFLSTAEA